MTKSSAASPRWTAWHSAGSLIVLAAPPLAVPLIGRRDLWWAWLATMASLSAFTLVAGHAIMGDWRGAFIDTRNKISLSRLQAFAWMALILSAVFTAGMANVASRQPNPLAIRVPEEVWWLMGIGTTSLAASSMIQGTKSTRAADPGQAAHTLNVLSRRRGGDDPAATLACRGAGRRQRVRDSRTRDGPTSSRAREVGNAPFLDLSKVQLIYATTLLTVVYAAALSALFGEPGARINALPAINSGLVALLGVSHAGYLASKAGVQSLPG